MKDYKKIFDNDFEKYDCWEFSLRNRIGIKMKEFIDYIIKDIEKEIRNDIYNKLYIKKKKYSDKRLVDRFGFTIERGSLNILEDSIKRGDFEQAMWILGHEEVDSNERYIKKNNKRIEFLKS